MKFINAKLIVFLLACLLCLPVKAGVFVIAHPSVEVEQVSPTFLSRVYAMQIKSWPNGQPIDVFSFPVQSAEFTEFTTLKAKVQPHQLSRHWKRLLFTGTGRTPTIVNSTQEMLQSVTQTPGSIGFINSNYVFDSVKVLKVKGIQ